MNSYYSNEQHQLAITMASVFLDEPFVVKSPGTVVTDDEVR